MAKKFAGFTPEQLGKIVPEMQGMQGDEQDKFLAANPAAASRVGKMAELAQKRIGMAEGGFLNSNALGGVLNAFMGGAGPKMDANAESTKKPVERPAPGGMLSGFLGNVNQGIKKVSNTLGSAPTAQQSLDNAQQAYADAQQALTAAIADQQANPEDEAKATAVAKAQAAVDSAQAKLQSAQASFQATEVPTVSETTSAAFKDPMSLVQKPEVTKTTEEQKASGEIDPTTGQITTPAPTAEVTTAEGATPAEAPEAKEAVTYEAFLSSEGAQEIMDKLEAATGKVGREAIVDAQTMNPNVLAQLGLDAAQLRNVQRVERVDERKLEAGELISGSTVDMEQVKKETNFQAATGSPSTDATVQGQLTQLMEDFEGTSPPPWAAGAMRQVAAQMAARGLSSSSMAGQAMVQAAMESAIPIAQIDAQTFAKFESQNLSNKQQAAMFAAQQRADFLKLDFNQEFQTRVANAAKISDIANMNFTAEQQVALENARMAQSVDLANLSAANAKVLADAAAMSQAEMANLNNRQQTAVQNAKSFLQMDMQNLNNEQQTAIFKSQQLSNALLSDTAAQNAAKQFNASSENQTNQFFANLQNQISMFNTSQENEMNRFNAGEANALSKFNAAALAAREQFNAQNALVVAQANAAWAQKITTTDNAAQNQANRDAAMAANNFTMTAYNNTMQLERDVISYAWRSAESQQDREMQIRLQAMKNEMKEAEIQAEIDASRGSGFGTILNTVVTGVMKKWVGF